MIDLRVQTKLFIAIAANILLFIGVILFVIKPYFVEKSIEQDRAMTRDQIESVSEVFANHRLMLERTLVDWSVWTNVFDFVQGNNESFVEKNLGEDTLDNLGIGAMIFLDENREVVYSEFNQFYELDREAERTAFTNDLLRYVNSSGVKQSAVYGTDFGPVVFMSHPIFRNDGSKDQGGTLILIEKIGPDFMATMSAQAKTKLSISPLSHQRLTIERDDQFARVSLPLQSIYQDANWEINFSVKRTYYSNTETMLELGMFGLLVLGIGLLLTLFWTVNQIITKRLVEIVNELKGITKERNSRLRIRLNPGKRDEIEQMAISMNEVLDALEQTQKESLTRAFRDSLTRLPNRLAVEEVFMSLPESPRVIGVMGIDLDNFRRINDQFGQRTGDAMLTFFASRLMFYKEDGFVARTGADEFILIHPGWTVEELKIVANQLMRDLREWGLKQGMNHLTLSIGIDELTDPAHHTYEVMMARLDVVLHEVKASGKDNILSYQDIEDGSHYLQALEMERDLRHALRHDEFELYYQPIVSPQPFRVRGVEALIRWHHPQKGFVSPGVFIPIAEQLGLISDVGRWVLVRAITEMQAHAEHFDLFLSVNVSKRQILDGSFLEALEETLAMTDFPPARLHVEITESEVGGNVYELQQFIQALKAIGVKISLDDFGVGTSSLSYLQSLRLDIIKIDQNFVKGIPENKFDRALLEGLYQTFHTLGLDIVTEGVERPEQLAFVLEYSGSLIQGYHYSKPIPIDQLHHYLRKSVLTQI
ncbi:EAL domain-containing protein [Exiguobacterium qingdaonense]|uniref:bifunctional diguanylate cyclase/phosphodiesterase n=1 Tax=Exiguobacterium qingdaonense TaxID=2751251 RepID=UPI001BED0D6E